MMVMVEMPLFVEKDYLKHDLIKLHTLKQMIVGQVQENNQIDISTFGGKLHFPDSRKGRQTKA